jgi:hypothetical protein
VPRLLALKLKCRPSKTVDKMSVARFAGSFEPKKHDYPSSQSIALGLAMTAASQLDAHGSLLVLILA